MQHNVTFFFVAAVMGTRYETQVVLGSCAKKILWLVPPPLLAVCWSINMSQRGSGVPYDQGTDQTNFITGVVAALVPWACIGALAY